MERIWIKIVSTYSPEIIEVTGTLLTQLTTYLLLALVFMPLDFSNPFILRNYQLRSTRKPLEFYVWRKFVKSALQNQLIVAILHYVQLLMLRRLVFITSLCRITAEIPPLGEVVADIIICTFSREVLFYYFHRFLHHPLIYRYFHKTHHQFTPPVALAGQHFHPVDYFLTGILPVIIPAFLMRVHVFTMWLNIILVSTEAFVVHCGYDFYGLLDLKPKSHDLHHKHSNVNYGVMGIMDYVHGTRYVEKSQLQLRN